MSPLRAGVNVLYSASEMEFVAFFIFSIIIQGVPSDGIACGNEINGDGFTNDSVLVHLNQRETWLLPDRTTSQVVSVNATVFRGWYFPNTLVFSCSGLLGGWKFRAESRNISRIKNLPLLKVFHVDTNVINPENVLYNLRDNSDQVPTITPSSSSDGVYEYRLQQPVQVEVGDIVGVQYQEYPTAMSNFLQLAYLESNTTLFSYQFQRVFDLLLEIPRSNSTSQQSAISIVSGYIPVITPIMYSETTPTIVPSTSAVEGTRTSLVPSSVLPTPTSSPPTPMLPSTISPSMSATPSLPVSVEETPEVPPTNSLAVVIGVGVAAGFVVALILAAIVVVVMLLVCRRKKSTQVCVVAANEFAEPLDNPTYNKGGEKGLPKISAEVYELPVVESNLDALPRQNGVFQTGYTPVHEDHKLLPAMKLESNSSLSVQNYEMVPELSQSGDLSSSVVYQEVHLKAKTPSKQREYYNVPSASATPQDYSLPADCRKPQDYAVPEDGRKAHPQDYAVPESSSSGGRPQGYATPQSSLDQLQGTSAESCGRPQDYSVPTDSRQPKYTTPTGLMDSQNYSLPEPEDYSTPVASERSTMKSEPYEVPSVSRLSNQRPSGSTEDPEGSSSLDMGLYVPTEREREMYGLQAAGSSSSVAPSSSSVDEAVYCRIAELQQKCSCRSRHDPFFVEDDIYWVPASNKMALYNQLAKKKYREILRTNIRIIRYLGSGQFGTVNLGCWTRSEERVEVAVKMLKPHSTEEDKVKFLQEAAIMGQFLHPHVVKLHGVVTMGEPIMIVLEYMEKGDLRNYLLAREKLQCASDPNLPHLLLNFCREISSGMAYLSSKSFVHRDLAARNILLSAQETCKIGDFGMSRDLEDNNYYITHGGQIPVRWTAPEALHFRKYSTGSDVWSYGMVMYEIWSLGRTPYDGHSNSQILELLSKGFRLPPPPGCSRALYELIIRCWHEESSKRPPFSAIVTMLSHDNAQLLHWSEKDISRSSPEARTVGAPKNSADNLYRDLQNLYKVVDSSSHT